MGTGLLLLLLLLLRRRTKAKPRIPLLYEPTIKRHGATKCMDLATWCLVPYGTRPFIMRHGSQYLSMYSSIRHTWYHRLWCEMVHKASCTKDDMIQHNATWSLGRFYTSVDMLHGLTWVGVRVGFRIFVNSITTGWSVISSSFTEKDQMFSVFWAAVCREEKMHQNLKICFEWGTGGLGWNRCHAK